MAVVSFVASIGLLVCLFAEADLGRRRCPPRPDAGADEGLARRELCGRRWREEEEDDDEEEALWPMLPTELM